MRDLGTRAVRDQSGFTIIEVMVAMVVLVVGILGTFALIDSANATTSRSIAREGATTLARDLVERARQIPFDSHGSAGFGASLRTALPDAATATVIDGSTFEIKRRGGNRYTVTVTACKVDDPTDGIGVHDATFCDFNDPAPPGGNPGPGAPTGSAITLKLLGLPIAVPLGGALIDQTVCGLVGANAVDESILGPLLGTNGVVNGILGLLNSGADLALCPESPTAGQVALDRTAADFSKVTATVVWSFSGQQTTHRQATLVANPGGV